MSPGQPIVCTHDLGPGTKVCLRCRQEERQADRARQQRLLVKGGVIGVGLVFAYVAGASVMSAVRESSSVSRRTEAPTMLGTTEVVQQGTQVTHGQPPASAAPAMERAPASSRVPAPAPLSIIVPAGRSNAPDSLILERTGDSVVVDFDTDAARTRRRDKFEHLVRRTLPLVYGPHVEAALRTVPEGALLNGGDLLTELPIRGIQLPLADGWMLDVFPETRAGRDGPLVVSYRTRVRRI